MSGALLVPLVPKVAGYVAAAVGGGAALKLIELFIGGESG